jgi:hypothetical protein
VAESILIELQRIEGMRELARAREIYARQDIVKRGEQTKGDFISERADIEAYVRRVQARAYSRHLVKPKIEVVA